MRAFLLDRPADPMGVDQLRDFGVLHERIPVEQRAAELGRIKRDYGYKDEDEVALSSDTPNLETICAKFDKEHFHTLDEVRFVIDGEGIFDVRDKKDRWVRIEVTKGDLIIIPANTYHRFFLTDAKNIRCARLFLNHEGWTPLYREQAATAPQS